MKTGDEVLATEEEVCENVIEWLIREIELAEDKLMEYAKQLDKMATREIPYSEEVGSNSDWMRGRKTSLEEVLDHFRDPTEEKE